ncbi:AMSH-like ubiquitin thioesterase 1 isoform X2 [Mangifera indica]|uniref:AMSH-like ubiquitin thioesterase 1 isoform X2 n=1 Tax=Mangifera indica TaxID=29780 RepID=UPI001CF97BF4|nr:AMSH-like ubiquitin thioesterase 1 isoform X2 [Mangifera indica]
MRSSSERINIAASAPRLHVDNRISMRYYYRIADNILKQADIFRVENNIIDLYVMLLRFSSLVTETIPCHRDYRASSQNKNLYLKKKLLSAVAELEELKPVVQQKINELNRKHTYQTNGWVSVAQNASLEWPSVKKQTITNYNVTKPLRLPTREFTYQGSRAQQLPYVRPVDEQFRRMSLNFPRPNAETLSRHTILGPNGLHGQWQPPKSDKLVKYPINIDLSPVEIPSLQQPVESGSTARTDSIDVEPEKSSLESITISTDEIEKHPTEEPCSMISFETVEMPVSTDIIKQPSPPPVLAEVQDLIAAMTPQVAEAECRNENLIMDEFDRTEPLQLHISTTLMDNFMKLAKSNTDKNLETCGVLAGSLKNRKFYVTALIIPKQESTSDSCQTINEEEIFEVQDKQSLFPLGWIHTHPTQSCFMSSIDVHTHYSYQKAWNFSVDNARWHVSNKTVSTTWLSSSRSTS